MAALPVLAPGALFTLTRVWFDAAMRVRGGSYGSIFMICALALVRPLRADEPAAAPAPARVDADAALRGLLAGPRATTDPALAELEALHGELSKHPLAASAGKHGLERARAELELLRALIGQQAGADRIARRKQLVWAALSLVDRQLARAEFVAALSVAQAQRARADARLAEARRAREQVEAELERAGRQAEP